MKNFHKQKICDGVNFTHIENNRFKHNIISATMFFPLDYKTTSENAILPFVLGRACKKFPSFIEINRKLSELYGATISTSVDKIGDNQALTISIIGLDDRYSLDTNSISKEITELLCSILFYPNVENRQFNAEDVNQEKRQLIELIDSEFADKRIYSRSRCVELMCANEKFGINRYGTKENVAKLTSPDVFEAWDRAIKNSKIELLMIGNSNCDSAFNIFKEQFSKIDRNFVDSYKTEVVKTCENISEYTDKMEVAQCKLVMGFRAGVANPDEEVNAMKVMTALFGGTPNSKLFLNVREKMSLCYYCAATYDSNKGIIILDSGVDKQNIHKAKNEILNQLNLVKEGDFSEFDILSAKSYLINYYKGISDSLSSLLSFYIHQIFNKEIITPEMQAEQISQITREDIIGVTKKVVLDTVYTLESKD